MDPSRTSMLDPSSIIDLILLSHICENFEKIAVFNLNMKILKNRKITSIFRAESFISSFVWTTLLEAKCVFSNILAPLGGYFE